MSFTLPSILPLPPWEGPTKTLFLCTEKHRKRCSPEEFALRQRALQSAQETHAASKQATSAREACRARNSAGTAGESGVRLSANSRATSVKSGMCVARA